MYHHRLDSKQIDEDTLIYQTGCWYTDEGQIIIVRRRDDGRIQFSDISRNVYGICPKETPFNARSVQQSYLEEDTFTLEIDYNLERELRGIGRENKSLVPTWRN